MLFCSVLDYFKKGQSWHSCKYKGPPPFGLFQNLSVCTEQGTTNYFSLSTQENGNWLVFPAALYFFPVAECVYSPVFPD